MKFNELTLSSVSLSELIYAVLSRKVSFRFKVRGFSMSPFIKDNDIVTLSPLFTSSVGFGRIVAFIHPETEKLFIHRIVGRSGNYYLIKGDRIPEADGLVPRDNILGLVTKVERDGKRFFFGFGLERVIIAFLSKNKFLPIVIYAGRLITIFIRRLVLWANL